MQKKNLKMLNILLIIILISIFIYEKYPYKIYNKIKPTKFSESSHLKNENFKQQLGLYEHYRKKGKIVMLGNSITYRVNWNELLDRGDIINRGVESDITNGFLDRMEFIFNVYPKLCFIMGGVNDLRKGIDIETTTNNLLKISKLLQERKIIPIIFSVLYVDKAYPNYKDFNMSVTFLNQKLKDMCAINGIDFINLNKKLSKNGILKKEYSLDGTHLTGLGYKAWGEIMSPIIKEKLSH